MARVSGGDRRLCFSLRWAQGPTCHQCQGAAWPQGELSQVLSQELSQELSQVLGCIGSEWQLQTAPVPGLAGYGRTGLHCASPTPTPATSRTWSGSRAHSGALGFRVPRTRGLRGLETHLPGLPSQNDLRPR